MADITLQSTVTPHIALVINGEGPAGNKTQRTWKLCLDYRALAKIEAHVKVTMDGVSVPLDLKKSENWRGLTSGNFPAVVWCCMGRYNPDVTLDEITECLNPQAYHALRGELFALTFPWVVEAAVKDALPNTIPDSQKTA